MADATTDTWRGSAEYWEKLAENYAALYKENTRSYIYVPLADALANLEKTDEAIEILEYGLALLPNSRAGKVLLAQLYYDVGEIAKSRKLLVEIVDKNPDLPAAVSLLCKIYEREGAYIKADNMASELARYYPESSYVKSLAERYRSLSEASEMTMSVAAADVTGYAATSQEDANEQRKLKENTEETVRSLIPVSFLDELVQDKDRNVSATDTGSDKNVDDIAPEEMANTVDIAPMEPNGKDYDRAEDMLLPDDQVLNDVTFNIGDQDQDTNHDMFESDGDNDDLNDTDVVYLDYKNTVETVDKVLLSDTSSDIELGNEHEGEEHYVYNDLLQPDNENMDESDEELRIINDGNEGNDNKLPGPDDYTYIDDDKVIATQELYEAEDILSAIANNVSSKTDDIDSDKDIQAPKQLVTLNSMLDQIKKLKGTEADQS